MTYVPPTTNAGSLYNFLLQQMAAESYFEKPMSVYDNNPQEVIDALTMGTNRKSYTSEDMPFNGGYPGLTRMTKAQATEFTKKFKIIDQWSDNPCPDGSRPAQLGDAGYLELYGQQILANTGLSATLIRVMAPNGDLTNEYTLAIRSTEMRPWDKGGDGERDKTGTDALSIGLNGFAFAQLDALEYYYQWLKVTGKLPVAVVPQDFKLNVTGYSLGGHLATVFTEIHQGEMHGGRTYAFNAPGRGEYSNGDLRSMLADFRRFMDDPDAAGIPDQSSNEYLAYKLAHDANAAGTPFDAKSIYDDARYRWALYKTHLKYNTGMVKVGLPSEGRTGTAADGIITHIWGKEIPNNANFTALSGIHGPALGVFIESQPLVEGWVPWGSADYGNGHSIVLLGDSLALMRSLQKLQPGLSIESLNALFPKSTNVTSNTDIIGSPRSGEYEYNALENVLDGLRRIFVDGNSAKTEYTKGGSGFADLGKRQKFYENIAALENSAAFQAAQGKITLTAAAPDASKARNNFGQFLSLYYLTPFSLTVNDPSVEAALIAAQGTIGSDWTHDKTLSPADRSAGKAVFSDQYLADRRAMLTFKLGYNQKNRAYTAAYETAFVDMENPSEPVYRNLFTDLSQASVDSEATVIDTSGQGNELGDRRIYFGSEGNDPVYTGGGLADHLYGMGGNDTLKGEGGKDWLEGGYGTDELQGGSGDDQLYGGLDNDSLYGGADNDWLQGGDGSDRLDGEAGKDALRGGAGTDLLFGGADNDALYGGDDADSLTGGTGNDWLEGGSGADVYHFKSGDGQDVIVDSDGAGRIEIEADGSSGVYTLSGGQGKPSAGQWNAIVGGHTYAYGFDPDNTGVGNLSIRRDDGTLSITVRNFQNGQLGITLSNLAVPTVTPPANAGDSGSEYAYQQTSFDAKAGNDVIVTQIGADVIDGGDGADYIVSTPGSKTIIGGDGADFIETGSYYKPNASLTELQQLSKWQNGWSNWQINILGSVQQQWSRSLKEALSGQVLAQYSHTWSTQVFYDITSSDSRGWSWVSNAEITDPQTFYGGLGNDTIDASDSSGSIYGDEGDDGLYGGARDDTLYGGIGNDVLYANAGDDLVNAGDDNDFVDGADGNDTLYGGAGADTLLGDGIESGLANRDDLIDGGDGDDIVDGGGGNDKLFGGKGNDTLFAASIDDPDAVEANLVDGGDGADKVIGSAGGDTLIGGAGNDMISGSDGADATASDDDLIFGDDGDDLIIADGGHDTVYGGSGNDSLHGDNGRYDVALHGNDVLSGDAGNDSLLGYGGDDSLSGGDDNDTLQGASGQDVLDGGAGVDTLDGGDGDDKLIGGDGDDGLGGATNAHYANGGGLSGGAGSDSLYGGNGQDLLNGGEGNDLLSGEADDDQLDGGDGDDVLDGGAATNTLIGGIGNDVYRYGGGTDVIYDTAGTDTLVMAGVSRDGVDIRQVGSQLQIITGQGTGIAIENGFSGAIDRFNFGAGASLWLEDLLPVANLAPQSQQVATYQTLDADSGESPIGTEVDPDDLDLRNFLRLGKNAFNLTGTEGDDSLYGSGANDYLNAGNGNNHAAGAGGNDNIRAGNGNDTLEGEDGNDTLSSTGGNDLIDGGAGNDNITNSGSGSSTLVGGLGSDWIYSRKGSDTVVVDFADGQDYIDCVSVQGGNDLIQVAQGIVPDDLTFKAINDPSLSSRLSLLVTHRQTGASIVLSQFFEAKSNYALSMRFADGTVLAFDQLASRAAIATADNDTLPGSMQSDSISGLAGNDLLSGYSGNDTLSGDNGNDTLIGGDGADLLLGGSGADVLAGASGNDTLEGGIGSDTLYGNEGIDTYVYRYDPTLDATCDEINLGSTDYLKDIVRVIGVPREQMVFRLSEQTSGVLDVYVQNGNARQKILSVIGAASAQGDIAIERIELDGGVVITGSEIVAALSTATNVNDTIIGFNFADSINGLAGDDRIIGMAGNDTLDGQDGNDSLYAGDGSDLVYGGNGNDVLLGDADNTSYVERVQPGNDTLSGGAGNDSIEGAAGNDRLNGGDGTDSLFGGKGDDIYEFSPNFGRDLVADYVSGLGGGGYDIADFSTFSRSDFDIYRTQTNSYGAADLVIVHRASNQQIEFRQAFSTDPQYAIEAIKFSGGELITLDLQSPYITVLVGSVDTVYGTSGNDVFNVDHWSDVIVESANQGQDKVISKVSYRLSDNVEILELSGNVDIRGTGNSQNNLIYGNEANNTIDGAGGTDSLYGGAGDDVYMDAVGDVIYENEGEGFDTVFLKDAIGTYRMPANVEALILPWSSGYGAIITMMGNTANNIIDGRNESWSDLVFDGGMGNDTYFGSSYDTVDNEFVIDSTGDVVLFDSSVTAKTDASKNWISTYIDYSLPENVNNIRLMGSANISANGSDLKNIIDGSTCAGANVLSGGKGDDTYIIGFGDSINEEMGDGNDTVVIKGAYSQNSTIFRLSDFSNVENIELNMYLEGGEAVYGDDGNNSIVFDAVKNGSNGYVSNLSVTTYAGSGNDTVYGYQVFGGDGNDSLIMSLPQSEARF